MPKVTIKKPKPEVKANVMQVVETLPEFAGEGGLQIISYSEMDTFRQCPLKHQLSYKERWKKPWKIGTPLSRGSLWHHLMEAHYTVIMKHYPNGKNRIPKNQIQAVLDEAWEAVREYLYDSKTGAQDEDQVIATWMYHGYVEMYGVDNDWQIIAIEYPFEVQLDDLDGNPAPFALKGKIDILAMDRKLGGFWIWDHKSGADLPTQMSLEIDDQFGGYTWAMHKLGYKMRGSMHSAARTKMNKGDQPGAILNGNVKKQTLDQRFSRTPLNRTEQEQLNLARDFYAAAVNAYPPEDKRLPIYSSPDPRQCAWKCDFKEIHLLARAGRDIHEVMKEYRFVQDFTRH